MTGSPLVSDVHQPSVVGLSLWPVWFAVFSGAIYLVGYLRLFTFLRHLSIEVVPTEIFSPGSLFVSGVGSLLTASIVPLVAGGCGMAMVTVVGHGFRPFAKRRLILVTSCIALALSLKFGFDQMPTWFDVLVTHSPYGPVMSVLNISFTALFAFAGSALRLEPVRRDLLRALSLSLLVLWLGSVIAAQVSSFRFLSIGMPPTYVGQDPGMLGTILTTHPIDGRSFRVDSSASGSYRTNGLLLGVRNGAYYFHPDGVSSHQSKVDSSLTSSLHVVPESSILGFVLDASS